MAEIRTIAVIGAGAMGRSIACATGLAGYRTILEDILPASLKVSWLHPESRNAGEGTL